MVFTIPCLLTLLASGQVEAPAQEIPGADHVLYATLKPRAAWDSLSPCLQFKGADGSLFILFLSKTSSSIQRIAPEGRTEEVAAWPLTEPVRPPVQIQLRSVAGATRLVVNGLLAGQGQGILPGQGGSVEPCPGWEVSEMRVQPLAEISVSDDFMRESIAIGDWETVSGDWEIAAMDHPDVSASAFTLRGSGSGALVAGQEFWDDEVFQISVKIEPGSDAVGLLFGWKDIENHHLLRWSCDVPGAPGRLSLVRVREGRRTLLAERLGSAPTGRWLALNTAFQQGRFQASVGGVAILSGQDAHLTGGKIGLWIEKAKASFDDAEVRSLRPDQVLPCAMDLTARTTPFIPTSFAGDSYMQNWAAEKGPWSVEFLPKAEIVDYTFNEAPVDWRPGYGAWKIFSRWICLPKFTFMGGDGDPQTLVALWHAWRFTGDHVAEAFVGSGMSGRPLPHYNFGVNRCLSICADGVDPLSGYALIWGGPDFPTRLVRKGLVIQENSDSLDPDLRDTCDLITTVLHRTWPCLRLEKEGPGVRGLVNGKLLFTFQDPNPIDSGQVCLWAWDRPLMVARARIAFRNAERPSWEDLVAKPAPGPKRPHFAVAEARGRLRVTLTDGPVDVSKHPRLRFEVMPQSDASLRLVIETPVGLFAAPLCGADPLRPDQIPIEVNPVDPDGQWHPVDLDIGKALRARRPDVKDWIVSQAFVEDVAGGDRIIPWLAAKPIRGWMGVRRVRFGKGPVKGTGPDPDRPGPPVLDMDPDPRHAWSDFEGSMTGWTPRGSVDGATPFLLPHPDETGGAFLRALDTHLGGCFGLYAPVQPYDLSRYPWIAFDARMGKNTNINLLLKIEGIWQEMVITGIGYDQKPLGPVAGAAPDPDWHACYANAWEAYNRAFKPCRAPVVQAIAWGDTGLWSHVAGDTYDLDNFEVVSEIPSDKPLMVRPRAEGAASFQVDLVATAAGERRSLSADPDGRFRVQGLAPGRYTLEVAGLSKEGQPGPKTLAHLFAREPWQDVAPPKLSELTPAADSQSGDKRIRFLLADEGSGVDFSSVRLKVQDQTFTLAGQDLEVDPCSGAWLWNGNRPSAFLQDGPISCSLSFSDLAGNEGITPWSWTFLLDLDQEAPVLGPLTLIPSPHRVFQGFEQGNEGCRDFDNVVVDWGPQAGPWDDHAIEYSQDGAAALFSGRLGIEPMSAREWPLLRMDVFPISGAGLGIIARVHDTDWTLPFERDPEPNQWGALVLDLEASLTKAGIKDPDLPVTLLAFQLQKPGRVLIDNVCLYARAPDRVKVVWPVPEDATGVSQYRYRVDENPEGPAEPGAILTQNSVEVGIEGEGPVFLHLQARDGAGNWGPAIHQLLSSAPAQDPKSPYLTHPMERPRPAKPKPGKKQAKPRKPA